MCLPPRRLLVLALPIFLAGCRSAAPLVVSTAAPAAVDGDAGEWAGGLRPVPGEPGLSLGVRHSADALTVVVVAGSETQARRVASGGMTLWLDPAGGTARRTGLRFPVGADAPETAGTGDDGPLRAAFAASTLRLATVRGSDVRPASAGGVPGVETAAAWTVAGLVVEARLPLRGPAAAAFAGEAAGDRVGLGLDLAEPARTGVPAAPSLTGRGTDGRLDDYGADRRERETAAPQESAATRAPGTRTTWLGVALAP